MGTEEWLLIDKEFLFGDDENVWKLDWVIIG